MMNALLAATDGYPAFRSHLPATLYTEGKYVLRFAQNTTDLDAVMRLRFAVFNVELGEGLDTSYLTGKDEDEFDRVCHHLMICDRESGAVVGTYRLQTAEMAAQGGLGFYSATEFDLSALPHEVLQESIELGRACIAKEHRSLQALYLLWRGLGVYLAHNRKRYLFGCCSLTSQHPEEGKRVMDYLLENGHVHPTLHVRPQPDWQCYPEGFTVSDGEPARVPRLMRVYLSVGAKICGPPALDRYFKTIDYLAFIDVEQLDPRTLAFYQYYT